MPFFLVAIVLLSYAVPLWNWQQTLNYDWRYFNALSWVVRSNVWHYGRFPLQDPWICGGLDLLANPQNRIFSPMGLLDIFLPPHLANLFPLVIYGLLGSWGAYRLFKELGASRITSLLMSALFINSSWFTLHYVEGHEVYGTMQLLPWVLWCSLRLEKRGRVFLLAALLSYFVLDGSNYTFIFGIYLAISGFFIFGRANRLKMVRTHWKFWAFAASCVAVVVVSKLLPTLMFNGGAFRRNDSDTMTLGFALKMLFWPLQRRTDPEGISYSIHEYSCYLGVLSVLIVGVAYFRKEFRRQNLALGLGVLFWLWTATGFLHRFNPWSVHSHLGIFNIAHVQSRVFILMLLLFLGILARALTAWETRKAVYWILCAGLLLESFAVRTDGFMNGYEYYATRPIAAESMIGSDNLEQTFPDANKPYNYLSRNSGSKNCYEPSFLRRNVAAVGELGYRGEIYYTSDGAGKAKLIRYTPGKISLAFECPVAGIIEINTNHYLGWKVVQGDAVVVSRPGELLRIGVPAGHGQVDLYYSPWTLPFQFAGFFFGALSFMVLGRLALSGPRSQLERENESSKV